MDISTFTHYQEEVDKLRFYPKPNTPNGLLYCILALNGEAGEVANKLKKVIRDYQGRLHLEARNRILDELGDVLWYLTAACSEMGISLQKVAFQNIEKLNDKREKASATTSPKNEEPSGKGTAIKIDEDGDDYYPVTCIAPLCYTLVDGEGYLCDHCYNLLSIVNKQRLGRKKRD